MSVRLRRGASDEPFVLFPNRFRGVESARFVYVFQLGLSVLGFIVVHKIT